MRTAIAKLSMALGAICLFGASLHAQSFEANAKVPFSFQAGGTVMPAGDYRFENSSTKPIAVLRNLRTGRVIFVPTGVTSVNYNQHGSIVFHRYGDEYFLAEVWAPYSLGSTLRTTHREKELMHGSRPLEASIVSLSLRAD